MDYKKLGKRIREYRTKTNMTQEELSEIVGLSPVYISQLETGVRSPSLETIVSIANALDVTIDYLVSGSLMLDEDEMINEILVLLRGRTREELILASDTLRTILGHVKDNVVL